MESMPPFQSAAACRPWAPGGAARQTADPHRLTIGSVIHHIPAEPVATSRDRGWTGVTIDVYEQMPVSMKAVPAYDHHLVGYCSTAGRRLVQRRAGKVHDSRLAAGMSIFMPAGYEAGWEGDAPASARLRIPVELVARAAAEIGAGPAGGIELLNNFGTRDTTLEFSARILMA